MTAEYSCRRARSRSTSSCQAQGHHRRARRRSMSAIYVRGDKKVDYGTMMQGDGRGCRRRATRVALVTEVEQGGCDEAGHDHIRCRPRRGARLLGVVAILGAADRCAAGRTRSPVEFISEKEFSQMTAGVKNAPQAENPDIKPLADKVGADKPVKDSRPRSRTSRRLRPTRKRIRRRSRIRPSLIRETAKADPKPPRPEAGRQAEAARIQAGQDR